MLPLVLVNNISFFLCILYIMNKMVSMVVDHVEKLCMVIGSDRYSRRIVIIVPWLAITVTSTSS